MDSRNAEASRAVAGLLRANALREDGDSLRSVSDRVQAFLATANTQPARPLESAEVTDEHGPVVELAVVAGVLEPQQDLGKEVDCTGGLLLPTSRTQESLKQRRLQEAEAMLQLMQALSVGGSTAGAALATDHGSTANDAASTSDDEVVFMAAEDLENEESSDDEATGGATTQPPAKRRLVEEMN